MTDIKTLIGEHRKQFAELLKATFGGLDFWRCSKKWKLVRYEETARMAVAPLEWYAQEQRAAAIAHLKDLGKIAKKNKYQGEYLVQAVVPILYAIAAYRAIGVLPQAKAQKSEVSNANA